MRYPPEDFFGHRSTGGVTYVWRDANDRFEHILVDTDNRNVFMVIVVDLEALAIRGHRLLDLNAEYGLVEPTN